MTYQRISEEEIRLAQVEGNLPDKPNQSTIYGGKALDAREVKAAFDKLPKLIINYFNNLIDELPRLADTILTGRSEEETLTMFFSRISTGEFAEHLIVEGKSLADFYNDFLNRITIVGETAPDSSIETATGTIYAVVTDDTVKALYLSLGEGKWREIALVSEDLPFKVGDGLSYSDSEKTLSVETTDQIEEGNNLPVTSSAVYAELGNIAALLASI